MVERIATSMASLVKKQFAAKEMREHDTSSKNTNFDNRSKPVSSVYVLTYINGRKLNLYGSIPIRMSAATSNSLDTLSHQFLRTPNGEDLNAEMLKCIS
jgi:hypothetical protein